MRTQWEKGGMPSCGEKLGGMPSRGEKLGGMPSRGAAAGRHVSLHHQHADPTLRVVTACHAAATVCHSPRLTILRRVLLCLAVATLCLGLFGPAAAQEVPNARGRSIARGALRRAAAPGPARRGSAPRSQVMLLLTVLSMAPAILLMTTCFVRIVVVLSLVRQAIGTQTLPPSQVITALVAVHHAVDHVAGLEPGLPATPSCRTRNKQITLEQAWTAGAVPLRRFMRHQIERCRQQRRRVADDELRAHQARAGKLRRRAAAGPVAGLHAQRAEDGVLDRLSNLSALYDSRHGGLQRDGVDGHADVAADADLAAA